MQRDLVPLGDEPGLALDLQGQVLHELFVELYDRPALAASGMVVHPLGRQLVPGVPFPEVLLPDDTQLVQKIQRPVHGGEAELGVIPLQAIVQLLRRQVARTPQLPDDNAPLVCQPVATTPE